MHAAGFRGIAPLRIEVRFSGTPIEFILLAEEVNDGTLDSRDMGDAMGVIIEHCMINGGEFNYEFRGETLTAELDYGNFQWEQTPMEFNINLDTLPPSI